MKKQIIRILILVVALVISVNTGPILLALKNEKVAGEYPYYAFIEDSENPWSSIWEPLDATGSYEYSDDYFAIESPGTHSALRTMSYALALAGFENQADGYPNDTGVVNPKMQKLLDELGFVDYEYWDEKSDEDGHSMGTSLAHKTITYTTGYGEDETKELIVLAPRNYNYFTEWLSNFNVGTEGDHKGFDESANLLVKRLDQYIDKHDLSNYKIWMVGYSRGGAVIDLVGKKVNQSLDKYDMEPDDLYVYTFGAPRASMEETKYSNIHDVKDGNDLLLGYFFPKAWGFYNTGLYEEIHPADLTIPATTINTTDLINSATVMNALLTREGLTIDEGTVNGKDFMDEWVEFVNKAGMTREYFDTVVKPPLSKLMKIYQSRTLDKQGELVDFIKGQSDGMLGMILYHLLPDLSSMDGSTPEEMIGNFPPYQDLVSILQGEATKEDIDELADYVERYIGEYDEYVNMFGENLMVSENEITVIRTAIPELLRALGPIIVEDAKYTRATYGDNHSLYYMTTLIRNAESLVYGHIPESLMPILEELHEEDPPKVPKVPNSGVAA